MSFEVASEVAVGRGGDARAGEVDEHARFVGAELIDEDGTYAGSVGGGVGGGGATQDNVSVVWCGEVGVLEDEADKVGADERGDVGGEKGAAELGEAAVGDQGEGGVVPDRGVVRVGGSGDRKSVV